MKSYTLTTALLLMLLCPIISIAQNADEQYRPQVHFSPEKHWVNDPNGMVYHKGVYHLFYQYHPGSSIWGPMHWGHATSTDLIHWKRLPVGLYPDSLGTIFSGSAVVDKSNTSGFGKKNKAPLVAIFTHHDSVGEKAGRNNFQNQSIAYSNDDGKTWTKYAGNPVLRNPGITDFRDPKVMWHAASKKWIMTLAMKDRIGFFSSPDLKNWTKESDFGATLGAHGGVWECPDLISFTDKGKERWVLIVNLNPGAPNLGSGTQYFVGNFDGHKFSTDQQDTRWLDYGPDNYAGVTWSNTGNRNILLGWMSNWLYANKVPTETWRNAMTIPREMKLKDVGGTTYVASQPVAELANIQSAPITLNNVTVKSKVDLSKRVGKLQAPCRIDLNAAQLKDFSLQLSNESGEQLTLGYDAAAKQYFIDRSNAGQSAFSNDFAARHVAPRLSTSNNLQLTIIIDANSIELFADGGLTLMTSLYFANKPYTRIQMESSDGLKLLSLQYTALKSIWK